MPPWLFWAQTATEQSRATTTAITSRMENSPFRFESAEGGAKKLICTSYLVLSLPVRWARPIVGAERRRRQPALVRQIRILRIVVERVTDGDRLRHRGRPNLHSISTHDLRFGPIPLSICS